jgi:site-specific recombinase XerD
MKGKHSGRSVPLHPEAAAAVEAWISELRTLGHMTQDCFLFQSREGGNRSISRTHAWAVLKAAANRAHVAGRVGTHSLRKTFAKGVYERTNRSLGLTQKALGHASVNSTVQYLSFADSEVEAAILGA